MNETLYFVENATQNLNLTFIKDLTFNRCVNEIDVNKIMREGCKTLNDNITTSHLVYMKFIVIWFILGFLIDLHLDIKLNITYPKKPYICKNKIINLIFGSNEFYFIDYKNTSVLKEIRKYIFPLMAFFIMKNFYFDYFYLGGHTIIEFIKDVLKQPFYYVTKIVINLSNKNY